MLSTTSLLSEADILNLCYKIISYYYFRYRFETLVSLSLAIAGLFIAVSAPIQTAIKVANR